MSRTWRSLHLLLPAVLSATLLVSGCGSGDGSGGSGSGGGAGVSGLELDQMRKVDDSNVCSLFDGLDLPAIIEKRGGPPGVEAGEPDVGDGEAVACSVTLTPPDGYGFDYYPKPKVVVAITPLPPVRPGLINESTGGMNFKVGDASCSLDALVGGAQSYAGACKPKDMEERELFVATQFSWGSAIDGAQPAPFEYQGSQLIVQDLMKTALGHIAEL